jgi:hypothetical protein
MQWCHRQKRTQPAVGCTGTSSATAWHVIYHLGIPARGVAVELVAAPDPCKLQAMLIRRSNRHHQDVSRSAASNNYERYTHTWQAAVYGALLLCDNWHLHGAAVPVARNVQPTWGVGATRSAIIPVRLKWVVLHRARLLCAYKHVASTHRCGVLSIWSVAVFLILTHMSPYGRHSVLHGLRTARALYESHRSVPTVMYRLDAYSEIVTRQMFTWVLPS